MKRPKLCDRCGLPLGDTKSELRPAGLCFMRNDLVCTTVRASRLEAELEALRGLAATVPPLPHKCNCNVCRAIERRRA